MNQIKVCHLTSVHSAFDVRIFHKECKSLVNNGFDVHLIAPASEDNFTDGITIHAIKSEKNRLKRRFKSAWDIYRKARKIKAVLYHFHDPELLPIGWLLRRRGAEVVYDVHEDYPAAIQLRSYIPPGLRKLTSKFFSLFEMAISKRLSGIVAADSGTCNRFFKCPNRIVLYNFPLKSIFLDKEIFLSKDFVKNGKYTLVHVGLISENYGIHIFLNALKILVNEYNLNVCLVLVGDIRSFELKKQVQIFLKLHNLEKNLYLTGIVPHQEVVHYISKANIGLIGLQPLPKFEVNIPTKMFEYMACGIPFVASNLKTICEFSGAGDDTCCILVDPQDSHAFAIAIKKLLADNDFAQRLGKNGERLFLAKFNWEIQGDKLAEFYNNILS